MQNPLSPIWLSKNIYVKIYRTIILLVFFTDVKLGLLHWMRVFENRVLRKILGPNREEVTGEWRRLHNELFLTKSNQEELDGRST